LNRESRTLNRGALRIAPADDAVRPALADRRDLDSQIHGFKDERFKDERFKDWRFED